MGSIQALILQTQTREILPPESQRSTKVFPPAEVIRYVGTRWGG